MKIAIIGNGAIGLSIGISLLQKSKDLKVTVFGESRRTGCASLAAAAMFNSFCEIEHGTLQNPLEQRKWILNKDSNSYWKNYIVYLEMISGIKINHGYGTFLINNTVSTNIEDENYNSIIEALKIYNEPHENVNPKNIPNYYPKPNKRSNRATYIPNEGWINPFDLISASESTFLKLGGFLIQKDINEIRWENEQSVNLFFDNKIDNYDAIVISNGANSTNLIKQLPIGNCIPRIFYGVGGTIQIKSDEITQPNCIRTPNRGLACGLYSAPQSSTVTVVGASNVILPTPENSIRVTSEYTLLKSCMEQLNYKLYNKQHVGTNVGWRPTSEDTFPILGPTSLKNVFIASGTKRDGLHMSPIIGDKMSDTILTGKNNFDDLFIPERKPIRHLTREQSIDKYTHQMIDAMFQHDYNPSFDKSLEQLENQFRDDITKLHLHANSDGWGIPIELVGLFRYKHIVW